jgi:hypothetical protein
VVVSAGICDGAAGGAGPDRGFDSLSGWTFVLAALVPTFSGGLILLYWFLQRGTIGEKTYGPDPLMMD